MCRKAQTEIEVRIVTSTAPIHQVSDKIPSDQRTWLQAFLFLLLRHYRPNYFLSAVAVLQSRIPRKLRVSSITSSSQRFRGLLTDLFPCICAHFDNVLSPILMSGPLLQQSLYVYILWEWSLFEELVVVPYSPRTMFLCWTQYPPHYLSLKNI